MAIFEAIYDKSSQGFKAVERNNLKLKTAVDRIKTNNINKLKIESVKTYYIDKNCKFNRGYFSRLYPNLKRVINKFNADIVLTDHDYIDLEDSKRCIRCKINNDKDSLITNERYRYSYPESLALKQYLTSVSSSYYTYDYVYIQKINNKKHNTLNVYDINDFLVKTTKHEQGTDKLSIEECLELIKQASSNDKKMCETALETICSYSTKYDPIKFAVFYIANINNRLFIKGKARHYHKLYKKYLHKNRIRCRYNLDSYSNTLAILKSLEKLKYEKNMSDDVRDLLLNVLQSEYYIELSSEDGEANRLDNYEITLSIKRKEKVDQTVDTTKDIATSINEFLV